MARTSAARRPVHVSTPMSLMCSVSAPSPCASAPAAPPAAPSSNTSPRARAGGEDTVKGCHSSSDSAGMLSHTYCPAYSGRAGERKREEMVRRVTPGAACAAPVHSTRLAASTVRVTLSKASRMSPPAVYIQCAQACSRPAAKKNSTA